MLIGQEISTIFIFSFPNFDCVNFLADMVSCCLDVLMQPSIRGYTIGATNALFKAKTDLSDVVVEIDEDRLEVHNQELRRAISLTTEDLRFIDNIVRVVSEEGRDQFLEGRRHSFADKNVNQDTKKEC